jgi:iron complex outermembrane receptor protein
MYKIFRMLMMVFVLVSFLAMPQVGLAEEYTAGEEVKKEEEAKKEKKAVELEEMVVTATRTEKGLEDVPGSVSVVTKEEMEKRSIKSVDEALNTTTGIYQSNMGGEWLPIPRQYQ